MVVVRANVILGDDRRSRGGGRSGLLPQRLEDAAGFLDSGRSALRRRLDFESRPCRPGSDAEDLDAVAPSGDDPGFHQALDRDRLGHVKLAGVDRALNPAQVDLVIDQSRRRVEAALRLTAMQGHLAAFEALDADARAGRLALAAAAGLLALAGSDAAPDADAGLRRSWVVSHFVEFHGRRSLTAVDDAHEMRDLGDHAAIGGRIGDLRLAADPVEAEALQRRALRAGAADGAGGLLQRDDLVGGHGCPTHESAASASTP